MAFKLSGSGGKEQQPKGSSFFGSLQKKAISAAAAASSAASAAGAAARQSVQSAKETLATGSSSSSTEKASFNPPPRVDEDLQRALENSMTRAGVAQAAAEKDSAKSGHEDTLPQNPQFLAGVEQLQSMGFEKDLAEVALSQTGGDVFAASSLLLGEDLSSPPGRPSKQANALSGKALDDSFRAEVTEFVRGDRIVIHSLTGSNAQALNGCQGRVLETKGDFCKGRILVEVDGMPKLLKAENLRKAPPAMSMQSQAKASYDSAKATILSVKQRAEAMFYTKSKGSASSASFQVGSKTTQNESRGLPDGRLSLQAAERRLQEARSRNAGTMDDWRRYRLEQERARRAGHTRPATESTANAGAQAQTHAEENLADLRREREADEEEDLQRALVASMGAASSVAEAATAAGKEPSAVAKEETPAVGPAEEFEPEEADPELFELRLREAMAEEELELQLALAASLEAECAAIKAEDEVSPAGAAACSSTDGQGVEHTEKVAPVMEDLATFESPSKQARLSDNLLQQQKLQQEQEALQAQLDEIRAAVAQHGDEQKHDGVHCSFEEAKQTQFEEKPAHGQEQEHQETGSFEEAKQTQFEEKLAHGQEQEHQETDAAKEEAEDEERVKEEVKESKGSAKNGKGLDEDKLTSETEGAPFRHESDDAEKEADGPDKAESTLWEDKQKELKNPEWLYDPQELKPEGVNKVHELEEGKPEKSKSDELLEEKETAGMRHEQEETGHEARGET